MQKLNHKILFVPFYVQCPQHRFAASARIRAEWPAKYLQADIVAPEDPGVKLTAYDLVIFQKCYNSKFQEAAKSAKEMKPDIKLALDLCDAEWLTREEELKAMIERMDFVTASTNQIKKWVQRNFPGKKCYKIPDGHDLDHYGKVDYFQDGNEIKVLPIHKNEPMKYMWYGNSGTIQSLRAILPVLERITGKGDTLTVIADERARGQVESQKIGVQFIPWTLETVNNEVRKGNLVLNPRLDTPGYAVKSNNKTVMAYILGLPCIDRLVSDDKGWMADLMKYRNPEYRIEDVDKKRPELLAKYSMEAVAELWKKTLDKELEK
jgi:hypothetical protein